MAHEDERRLGRLAVERGLLTQEQVLALLRARNADPEGPDLGARMAAEGLVDGATLAALRRAAAAAGEAARHEASTEHEIQLGSTRELIARDCLEEALGVLTTDREGAVRELRRLAEEFPDTESGIRAKERLRELEAPRSGA